MDASKFQVNFLQLLLNWIKRVANEGELYIDMFIKEATSYKLEFLYNMQVEKTASCSEYWDHVIPFICHPIVIQKQCIIMFLTKQFVYIAVI